MKNVLMLLAIVGGYFLYTNDSSHMEIASYSALIEKAEYNPVSIDEVILGANLFVQSLCKEAEFSENGASSCTETYQAFKPVCEERIFSGQKEIFNSKTDVMNLVARFSRCAGV